MVVGRVLTLDLVGIQETQGWVGRSILDISGRSPCALQDLPGGEMTNLWPMDSAMTRS